jgi:hypothetical protein
MTPHLVKWHKRYSSRGLTVVEVNNGAMDSLAAVQAHVASDGLPFPVFHDAAGATSRAYGLRAYPAAYLIGRDGKVIWEGFPGPDVAAIERAIEKALDATN